MGQVHDDVHAASTPTEGQVGTGLVDQPRAVRSARLEEIRSVLSEMDVANVRAVVDALRAFDRAADDSALAGLSTG